MTNAAVREISCDDCRQTDINCTADRAADVSWYSAVCVLRRHGATPAARRLDATESGGLAGRGLARFDRRGRRRHLLDHGQHDRPTDRRNVGARPMRCDGRRRLGHANDKYR